MARVVIDIPDEVFDDIKDIVKTNRPLPNQNIPTLLRMVADGIVIPEGHGDLIDRKALSKALKSGCEICGDINTNWCERCCPHNDFEDLIDEAATVIESDKENGND